jgi:hypothetical protein
VVVFRLSCAKRSDVTEAEVAHDKWPVSRATTVSVTELH